MPNDLVADPAEQLLLTGYNMAGKSTYPAGRANAIMAQMGSHSRDYTASLGLTDRVLHIGARDDLRRGESTSWSMRRLHAC